MSDVIKTVRLLEIQIRKNKTPMPRTALRYAIEKMPKELKQKAMAR